MAWELSPDGREQSYSRSWIFILEVFPCVVGISTESNVAALSALFLVGGNVLRENGDLGHHQRRCNGIGHLWSRKLLGKDTSTNFQQSKAKIVP